MSLAAANAHVVQMQRHTQERIFSCDRCGCKFTSYKDFLKHSQTKHMYSSAFLISSDSTEFSFKCKICQKVFKPRKQCVSAKHTSFDNLRTEYQVIPPSCKRCIIDYLALIGIATYHKHEGRRTLLECQTCCEEMDGFVQLCAHRHEGELYRCLLCGETVQSKELLDKHTRAHFEMTPTTCKTCFKRFETPAMLTRHMDMHVMYTFYEPYVCGVCHESFFSVELVKIHIQKHAADSESVNGCQKYSQRKRKLMDQGDVLEPHTNMYRYSKSKRTGIVHKPETVRKSTIKGLDDKNIVQIDVTDMINVKSGRTIIDISIESEEKRNSVAQSGSESMENDRKEIRVPNTLKTDHKQNRQLSKGSEEKRNSVEQLEVSYNRKCAKLASSDSQKSVNRNMPNVNIYTLKNSEYTEYITKELPCEICKKSFQSIVKLKAHKRTHDHKQYTCRLCQIPFTRSESLKDHLFYVHNSIDQTDTIKVSLNRKCATSINVKRNGSSVKDLSSECFEFVGCEICNKVFNGVRCLEDHKRTHTLDTQYKCGLCHITFTHSDSLNDHLFYVHSLTTE